MQFGALSIRLRRVRTLTRGERRRHGPARRLACGILLGLVTAGEADAEWTVAAYLGASRTRDTSLALTQAARGTSLTLAAVHYDGASWDPPLYYGYRAAFFPRSRWWGIEGELIHLKAIADTAPVVDIAGTLNGQPVSGSRPMREIVERFEISHGVNLVLLNAVFRRPLADAADRARPRLAVAGRLGAGASVPHPESTIDGESHDGYEWGAFSMQGAAGIELRLGGRVYIVSEYKLTRTAQNVAVAGGTARTSLVTHHVIAGLATRLGS